MQAPNPKRIIASRIFFILSAFFASITFVMLLTIISDNFWLRIILSFCIFGLIGVGLVEAYIFAGHTEKIEPKVTATPILTTSNVELKKQANQLSNEIIQFVSDRDSNKPQLTWRQDEKMMKKTKEGGLTINRNSAAYKRAEEEWNRDSAIQSAYYAKTQNDFVERYAKRYAIIITELEKKGVNLSPKDKSDAHQINPISMQRAAVRLGVLANELPDN